MTGATRWGEGRLKIEKSALILEKRPDCVHLWIKPFIRNEVLTVGEKYLKMFPSGAFFVCF